MNKIINLKNMFRNKKDKVTFTIVKKKKNPKMKKPPKKPLPPKGVNNLVKDEKYGPIKPDLNFTSAFTESSENVGEYLSSDDEDANDLLFNYTEELENKEKKFKELKKKFDTTSNECDPIFDEPLNKYLKKFKIKQQSQFNEKNQECLENDKFESYVDPDQFQILKTKDAMIYSKFKENEVNKAEIEKAEKLEKVKAKKQSKEKFEEELKKEKEKFKKENEEKLKKRKFFEKVKAKSAEKERAYEKRKKELEKEEFEKEKEELSKQNKEKYEKAEAEELKNAEKIEEELKNTEKMRKEELKNAEKIEEELKNTEKIDKEFSDVIENTEEIVEIIDQTPKERFKEMSEKYRGISKNNKNILNLKTLTHFAISYVYKIYNDEDIKEKIDELEGQFVYTKKICYNYVNIYKHVITRLNSETCKLNNITSFYTQAFVTLFKLYNSSYMQEKYFKKHKNKKNKETFNQTYIEEFWTVIEQSKHLFMRNMSAMKVNWCIRKAQICYGLALGIINNVKNVRGFLSLFKKKKSDSEKTKDIVDIMIEKLKEKPKKNFDIVELGVEDESDESEDEKLETIPGAEYESDDEALKPESDDIDLDLL